jgi:hypothetical protein
MMEALHLGGWPTVALSDVSSGMNQERLAPVSFVWQWYYLPHFDCSF